MRLAGRGSGEGQGNSTAACQHWRLTTIPTQLAALACPIPCPAHLQALNASIRLASKNGVLLSNLHQAAGVHRAELHWEQCE